MKRNDFLKQLGMLTGGSLLLAESALASPGLWKLPKLVKQLGIQLFSLPKMLEADFEATIAMLSKMGYSEIELFGPYTFSAPSAQERWKAVTPMLGFNGSGYFGLREQEVKAIFKAHQITIPSMHTDLDTLENHMESLGNAGQALGATYVVLPAIPDERRQTLDDYKAMADTFNKIGKSAKEVGLKFAYHNHGYGLSPVDGQIPLHLILDHTDPELVFLEMDIFWTIAGKADPIAYLKKYKNRYHLMHVKDMKEHQTFSGDGGDAAQWIALFPNMASCGEGVLDLEAIIPAALDNGVKHFFVEQDMVADPEVALKKSSTYLSKL
ncbi:sugar phosphate isomerase/epimerase [Arenibacter sp. GZD96]|uniref:sugar phosphate isomerase/epimerase family protein n=1 Tax=Aurantibrevibacter litoralis TaxID=3106030 RepID=UPI002AFF4D96|nr:sugar phosphate isomerase/epimerase [Arenibacter sp. GZD-96]MEA1786016.1 sugar phosphate isomerase/epimerase [Arenibacter sp. GZD-96]